MIRATLSVSPEALAEFCQRWKISEFALFGSALREDFRPDSDVDVLVTFADGADWGLFDHVRMQQELKTLLKREVDLFSGHYPTQMPYEYRRLTPQECEEVLRQRRERGYPLHAPPHPFRHAGHYLITAANYEHATIMGDANRRTEFESRLLSLDLVSAALKQLHGTTSREWNLADDQTGRRRVWYKFSDRLIRHEAHYYHLRPRRHARRHGLRPRLRLAASLYRGRH